MKKIDNEGNTTSLGLLCFANEYFKAYEILGKDKSIKWTSSVLLSLFCHGVELSLKAFLKNRGKSIKELIDLGHDMDKIVDACKGLNENKLNILTQHDWAVVSILNQQYKNKEFEYIITGLKQLPSESDIKSTFKNMLMFNQSISQDCFITNEKERETCPSPSGRGAVKEKVDVNDQSG